MADTRADIRGLKLGGRDNLVYLIGDPVSQRVAVVDPAWDIPALLDHAEGIITDILITHWHEDHTNGIDELRAHTGAQVHVLDREADYWGVTTRPLARHWDGDRIPLGGIDIRVMHTPGHSPGSTCYQVGDALFTGDTLFVYGCGRCDLPGGDARALFHSLRRLRESFPPDIRVFPGHDYADHPVSTLGEQVRLNPFLHQDTEADFIAFRAEHNRHRHPPYRPVPRGAPAW